MIVLIEFWFIKWFFQKIVANIYVEMINHNFSTKNQTQYY